jgi:dTDP-L-rhamnose 4-epimerase
MQKKILITGGAGFIGSHLCDELLDHGYEVRVLDSLHPQVHGAEQARPAYLADEVELMVGDVRDRNALDRALAGVDAVYHFAAAVGVGQSMYEIATYTSTNGLGTAALLEAIARRPVERLIVASSMSIYGEGLYLGADGKMVHDASRSLAQLKARDWEVGNEKGAPLRPLPTPEGKCPGLPSVYAISKYEQERLCMVVAPAYGVPVVALRFFNVYGTRQALSNPYTGVLAIFASRYLNGQPPLINEDGLQQRDFVSVLDVVQAARLALEIPRASGHVFNVGSGRSYSVCQIADQLARVLGRAEIKPEVTGRYRVGDIRNCFADIALARSVLGYKPRVTLEEGLRGLAAWLEDQTAVDHVPEARRELEVRGLTV